MRVYNLTFVDSASYLAIHLRKLPEPFGLTVTKSWYPHYFNTKANLDYVVPMPDKSYYDFNDMNHAWYQERDGRVYHKKRVLEQYCQDDVTVLRQACQIFGRDFAEIRYVDILKRV
jgi:hypothetical protein